MSDKLSFLSQEEEIEQAELIAEEVPQEAPPEPEAQAPEPAPVIAEEPKPETQHVPLATFLDMRDKVKAAEQKAKAHEEELNRIRAAQEAPEVDFFENPQAVISQATINAKLDVSEEMARDKFGDEVVDQARDWALQRFNQVPGYQAHVLSQRNPYRFIVQEFQREQIASNVSVDEFEQFKAWKAAQGQVTQKAPAIPAPPAVPTPSMASAASAGGVEHVPTGPGQAYDSLFQR